MIKIFLTNLGKYNEGELVGEWIDLPVDDDFEQAFKDIGISDEPDANGNIYEEYFITDYEAPFKIGEYDNIFDLNELAQELENEDVDEDVFKAISDYTGDENEALKIIKDGDFIIHICSYDGELAEELCSEMGYHPNPEYYFDYASFGRDLELDGYFDELIYDYRSQGDDEYADELEEQFENMSDYEKGEYYVDGIGDISELGETALGSYYDYSQLEDDMMLDGNYIPFSDGYIELI